MVLGAEFDEEAERHADDIIQGAETVDDEDEVELVLIDVNDDAMDAEERVERDTAE